jgi:hypothetical protein
MGIKSSETRVFRDGFDYFLARASLEAPLSLHYFLIQTVQYSNVVHP